MSLRPKSFYWKIILAKRSTTAQRDYNRIVKHNVRTEPPVIIGWHGLRRRSLAVPAVSDPFHPLQADDFQFP